MKKVNVSIHTVYCWVCPLCKSAIKYSIEPASYVTSLVCGTCKAVLIDKRPYLCREESGQWDFNPATPKEPPH